MPIPIKELKKLNEEQCYSRKSEGESLVLNFLINHPNDAFTTNELYDGLVKENTSFISPKSSVVQTLYKLKQKEIIKKKGSYYYYEQK